MGIRIPEEDGSQGATLVDAVIAIIEITKVCPHTADVFQTGRKGLVGLDRASRRSLRLRRLLRN